jgi:hypothetical protein
MKKNGRARPSIYKGLSLTTSVNLARVYVAVGAYIEAGAGAVAGAAGVKTVVGGAATAAACTTAAATAATAGTATTGDRFHFEASQFFDVLDAEFFHNCKFMMVKK